MTSLALSRDFCHFLSILNSITESAYFPLTLLFPFFLFSLSFLSLFPFSGLFCVCTCEGGVVVIWGEEVNMSVPFEDALVNFLLFRGI